MPLGPPWGAFWVAGTPTDGDAVETGVPNFQNIKAVGNEFFGLNFDFPNTGIPRYTKWVPGGVVAGRPAAIAANTGLLYYSTDGDGTPGSQPILYRSNGATWDVAGAANVTLADASVTTAKLALNAVTETRLASTAQQVDAFANVVLTRPSASSVALAGNARVSVRPSPITTVYVAYVDIPLTADLTVSGAGGLDVGVEAPSTWYYAHLIMKESDKTVALILSTVQAAPAVMPAGYTHSRFIGACYNNAGSDLLPFIQRGSSTRWTQAAGIEVVAAGADLALTAVNYAAAAPPIAAVLHGIAGAAATGGTSEVAVSLSGNNTAAQLTLNGTTAATNLDGLACAIPWTVFLESTGGALYYKTVGGGAAVKVRITGFDLVA